MRRTMTIAIVPSMNASCFLRAGSKWNQRFESCFAQIKTEPDHHAHDDVDVKRISRSPVRDDRAAEVAGQKNGAEDGGGGDEVHDHARELEDSEGNAHRRRQGEVTE